MAIMENETFKARAARMTDTGLVLAELIDEICVLRKQVEELERIARLRKYDTPKCTGDCKCVPPGE